MKYEVKGKEMKMVEVVKSTTRPSDVYGRDGRTKIVEAMKECDIIGFRPVMPGDTIILDTGRVWHNTVQAGGYNPFNNCVRFIVTRRPLQDVDKFWE